MRTVGLVWAVFLLAVSAQARDQGIAAASPNQFEIGRRTFWDFGPPNNYYDIFVVRPHGEGSTVERIILTPPVSECIAPAKFEYASGTTNLPPAQLLGSINPCAIPEKVLRKPSKCRHCARFSGADIVVRVKCGPQSRLIPSHVFEDYWFDPAAKAPHGTFSVMQLVKMLDDAVGPGVMEKPAFEVSDESTSAKPAASGTLRRLNEGEFDDLFRQGPDKPSELYQSAQKPPPTPIVTLSTIIPIDPESAVMPSYPPIARVARVEGEVTFGGQVNADGTLTNVVFVSGNRLFQATIEDALKSWKFPKSAYSQQIRATIVFGLNCRLGQP